MKHLFVNYEIAKLLKEKGFDEKCLAYYQTDTELFQFSDDVLSNSSYKGSDNFLIMTPLYQQVVDWFREKHNIYIAIEFDLSEKSKLYPYIFGYTINHKEVIKPFTDNYYQALDKAILEAIKLI